MNRFFSLCALLVLLCWSTVATASHVIPRNISYRCLGNNLYEVQLHLLHYCDAIGVPSSSSVQLVGTGTCSAYSQTLTLTEHYVDTVVQLCTSEKPNNACYNGTSTYFGDYISVFIDTFDFSALQASTCGWKLSFSNCCRSGSKTNIQNPSSSSMYIETQKFPNTGISCNSSPALNNYAISMTLHSMDQRVSHAMLDEDGDSLVYELATPLQGNALPITYFTGLSTNYPFLTISGTYGFDSWMGQSSFTGANLNQIADYDIVVHEYRNGVLLGNTRQTAYASTIGTITPQEPIVLQQVRRYHNGRWINQGRQLFFEAQPTDTVRFQLDFTDADTGDSIRLSERYSTLQRTYPNAVIQAIYGLSPNQLTLDVTIPNPRYADCALAVTDDQCLIPSTQSYTIRIMRASNLVRFNGHVYIDTNNTCLPENYEPILAPYELRFIKGNNSILVRSDPQGHYAVWLDTGAYTVQLTSTPAYYQLCSSAQTLLVVDSTGIQSQDLAAEVILDCPLMSVDVGAPLLLHCQSSVYTIRYCNTGTVPLVNTYIDLWLDSLFAVDSTTHPIDSQSGTYYRFFLDTVPAFGHCSSFRIYGHPDSACQITNLGHTYCAEAKIRADSSCSLWSGPHLEVEGLCRGDSVSFRILNVGDQAMSSARSYTVIEDNIIIMQMGGPVNLSPGAVTPWFSFYANGSTYRVEIEQEPNNPWGKKAAAAVSGCISSSSTGSVSTGLVNQFSLYDGHPTRSVDCQHSIGAYDPNDKQGFPVGYSLDHYIEPGVDLEYRIRFQNTGTFFATDIVLRDTLSPYLDPTTIQPTVSSHAYTWRLIDQRILEIRFDNIMLPDSGRDLTGSIGFVDFRIQQQPNLPLQTRIENSAAIYFDQNLPIITNTTWHTVNENFITILDLPTVIGPNQSMVVTAFPNPFEQSTIIKVEGHQALHLQLEIYDTIGRRVGQAQNDGNSNTIVLQRSNLPSGVYLYRLLEKDQLLHTGKLVIQ